MNTQKNILLNKVDDIMKKYNYSKHDIIAVLLETQDLIPLNYIPMDVAAYISEKLDVPLSKVYDVISFYSALSDKPKGHYVIQVCKSAVCKVNNYETLVSLLEKELGIKIGETTSDGKFTLEYSPCFGACDVSPAIKIGHKVYGNLDESKIKEIIKEYRGV